MKMRKYLLLMVLLLGFLGCTSHFPEKCEQLYETQQIPALSKDSYNTCDAVFLNYAYFVRWNDVNGYLEHYPNPFESLMQDTVMMCGFIKHFYGKPFDYADDNWWMCSMTDDSISAMDPENHIGGTILVQGKDKAVLNEINDMRKCYLIGIMTYDSPFIFEDSPADPMSCCCLVPYFQVVQIKNFKN